MYSRSEFLIGKQLIRERVWRNLEASGAATFPRPARGRVPNFVGSAEAARRLRSLPLYLSTKSIFSSPDAAQLPVREAALRDGKALIMATPRLEHGFVLLDPAEIEDPREAATIRGALRRGKRIRPSAPGVGLIVEGSVAVDRGGGRVGKGGGFGDLEFAILRELGAANDSTPIATTVHPAQIVDFVPMAEHDVPVDLIVTPGFAIKTKPVHPRPRGVIWQILPSDALKRMPILAELRRERDTGR